VSALEPTNCFYLPLFLGRASSHWGIHAARVRSIIRLGPCANPIRPHRTRLFLCNSHVHSISISRRNSIVGPRIWTHFSLKVLENCMKSNSRVFETACYCLLLSVHIKERPHTQSLTICTVFLSLFPRQNPYAISSLNLHHLCRCLISLIITRAKTW
jgi:hypothetical protein